MEGGEAAVPVGVVAWGAHVGLPEDGFALGESLEGDAGGCAVVVAAVFFEEAQRDGGGDGEQDGEGANGDGERLFFPRSREAEGERQQDGGNGGAEVAAEDSEIGDDADGGEQQDGQQHGASDADADAGGSLHKPFAGTDEPGGEEDGSGGDEPRKLADDGERRGAQFVAAWTEAEYADDFVKTEADAEQSATAGAGSAVAFDQGEDVVTAEREEGRNPECGATPEAARFQPVGADDESAEDESAGPHGGGQAGSGEKECGGEERVQTVKSVGAVVDDLSQSRSREGTAGHLHGVGPEFADIVEDEGRGEANKWPEPDISQGDDHEDEEGQIEGTEGELAVAHDFFPAPERCHVGGHLDVGAAEFEGHFPPILEGGHDRFEGGAAFIHPEALVGDGGSPDDQRDDDEAEQLGEGVLGTEGHVRLEEVACGAVAFGSVLRLPTARCFRQRKE